MSKNLIFDVIFDVILDIPKNLYAILCNMHLRILKKDCTKISVFKKVVGTFKNVIF